MVDRPPKGDDVTAASTRALGDPPAAGDGHALPSEPAGGNADAVSGSGNGVAGHEAGTRDGGSGRSIATVEKGVRRTGPRRWLRRAVLGLGLSIALFPILLILDSYLIVFDIGALARKAPDRTRVMERRLADPRTPRPLRHRFVSLGAISPHLAHAVVVHEDATFYQHRGFDEFEIRAALQKSLEERRPVRGASTITSQLARNLYLGTERSLIRKLREIPLTVRLEAALEKRRILELYLNFAEWGPGVFGAEAASRYHFGVSARNLSPAQAALMAAALPSPRRSTPAVPSPYLRRRAAIILARMQARGWLSAAAREEGRWALGLRGKPEPVDADLESGAGDELAPVPEPMIGPAEGLDAVPLPETGQPELETTDPNSPPPPSGDGAPHGDSAPDATPPGESQNPVLPEGDANPLVPDDGSAPEPAGPESDPPIQP
jgi:monofunctional biosynthetic peptidoglycan transglycosylase